jgi:hypothetical protein
MTSRAHSFVGRITAVGTAAIAVAAFAWTAQAGAQGPPAVVDQYKPSPPVDADPDGQPGGPDGDGDGVPGSPVPGGGSSFGEGPLLPGGAAGLDGSSDSGQGDEARAGSAGSSFAQAGGMARDTDSPSISGYPVTDSLIALFIAIGLGLATALAVGIRRRYAAREPLAEAG